jgi:hypothetical protein
MTFSGAVVERTGMRSNSGRAVRVAAIAAAAIVAGSVPGAQAAAGEQTSDASLTYACGLPSGGPVTVRIRSTFPGSGTVGRPIRPGSVKLTATLPRDVIKGGSGPVAGLAQLGAIVRRGGSHAEVAWPPLMIAPTPMPEAGDLVLSASGAIPATTPDRAGDLTFDAGPLTLMLAAHQSGGAAGNPLRLSCAPARGQDTTLASVPVSAPAGGGKTRRATPLDDGDPLPECEKFEEADVAGCTYLTGYSNVKKLGGAALVLPGIMNIALFNATSCGNLRFCISADANLNYRPDPSKPGKPQLPPSPATFLTFGFMPTKGTLELTQEGLIHIQIVLDFNDPTQSAVTATGQMWIRLFDVTVNGRALDVGDRCRTVRPMDLSLSADPNTYSINDGGVLFGTVEIPPFGGCRNADEDLDKLLTGSISGPDNYLKMTQGSLCTFDPPPTFGCPPLVPTPVA